MTFEAQYFTKRSVTIAAMPTDGTPESNRAVIDWTRDSETRAFMDENGGGEEQLSINTLEGAHWVTPGDWIVRGIKGEHYPVKPDIFAATYDKVDVGDHGGDDDDDGDRAFTVAELARAVAGGARVFASGGMAVDYEDVFSNEEAAIMAEFVRDNPDAPVPAMFIHLGLKKRYPRTEPNTADMFTLSLFHAACTAAFKFEAERAAEEAAAQAKPAPSGGWPGDRALQPQKPGFSPSGFTPR